MPEDYGATMTEREAAAWDLIPWYLTGTLDAGERRLVEEALAVSPGLRAELAAQRRLAAGVATLETLDVEMERSLMGLRQRIETEKAEEKSGSLISRLLGPLARLADLRLKLVLPLGAVAASLAVVLVTQAPLPPREAHYHTLTNPAVTTTGPQLRVKAAEGVPEPDLERLFAAHALRIADGPSASGVYTLEIAAGGDPQAIARELIDAPEIAFASVRVHP